MTRTQRICFVAPFGYPVLANDRAIEFVGGAEMQQSLIARELARRGYDVSMISMDFGQSEGEYVHGVRMLKMHLPDAGVPIFRFLHPRLTSQWAAMGRANADVYYTRSAGASTGFVAAFARRHGKHSIFSGAHDSDFDPAALLIKYARDRAIYRWGVRKVTRIVVQSRRQQEQCRAAFGRDAALINSCYGHLGRPARHDGVVLWVATAKQHKRPHLFVDVARQLPQYQFKLVGGPTKDSKSYFEAVHRAAAALDNIELAGFVPAADIETQFDGASLFVNTSVGEGFPNTFLQAWSRGMPTVSFFDAEAKDDHGTIGYVVPSVDGMVQTIRMLKEQPALWAESGRRARAYCSANHAIDVVVDDYERLLASLPESPRGAVAPGLGRA